MPTIYIPIYENGERKILEITPRWNCFIDRSNHHAIFIDGGHYHESQLFRSREAVTRYYSKMPVPAVDYFTVAELVKAWEEVQKK